MGRQWGVFVIKVPKDFGDKVVRWTLIANGETQTVPFSLNKGYPITPFKELGMGNQPPTLWFSEGGAKVTGPPVGIAASFSGAANQPVRAHRLCRRRQGEGQQGGERGHGVVAQASRSRQRHLRARAHPGAEGGRGDDGVGDVLRAGRYLLRVQANDESGEGGGGFQCCWTNTYVKVIIK